MPDKITSKPDFLATLAWELNLLCERDRITDELISDRLQFLDRAINDLTTAPVKKADHRVEFTALKDTQNITSQHETACRYLAHAITSGSECAVEAGLRILSKELSQMLGRKARGEAVLDDRILVIGQIVKK